MFRELPAKPSLEYLRKQAKQLQRTASPGKLADAHHALAREYGFADWARLKSYVITLGLTPAEALTAAIRDQGAQRARELLESYPELRAKINKPLPNYGFGQHALFAAVQRSDRATIDVLLDAGADIHKRTEWWAGGFGLLDDCDPTLVNFLVERGAVIDVHAAARLGMIARQTELVAADQNVVHAKGGDGQTPLHFASRLRLLGFFWIMVQRSTRSTWTTNLRRPSTCCVLSKSVTIHKIVRTSLAILYRKDAEATC
ncbi:Ankyrin 1 [Acidisarcina polymorpha]|uniref:Ankyrin 1 n=1 Tax=Acidisarcina polymorpha TaxID=2211140 RepID=A0A2Z5FV56_9BACT|nr:hypothetical protein [Acidisarcina polymorpha]AXC10296.1 Ankyrin 1 [Acidisarcina polymorpha]